MVDLAAVLFLRRHDALRGLPGRHPRLREGRSRRAQRGGLTPIVVDFIYKRRVAEVLLDFVPGRALLLRRVPAAVRLRSSSRRNFAASSSARCRWCWPRSCVAFFAVGVYRGVWRHFSSADAVTIVKGTIVGAGASMLAGMLLFQGGSPTVFVIYAIIVAQMVIGSRASFGVIAKSLQRRRQTGRRIVIYGAGDGGAMAVRELMNDAGHDVRILGFIDDDARKRRNRVRGYPVLGSFDRLSQLIEAGGVDGVVLSIRSIDPARVRYARSALPGARGAALAADDRTEPDRRRGSDRDRDRVAAVARLKLPDRRDQQEQSEQRKTVELIGLGRRQVVVAVPVAQRRARTSAGSAPVAAATRRGRTSRRRA